MSKFSTIEIVFDLKYKDWKNPLKSRLFIELSDYLDIQTTDIKIISVNRGSIIATLQLPDHSAIKLIDDFNLKFVHLKPLLKLFQIVKISHGGSSKLREDIINMILRYQLIVSIKILKDIISGNEEFEISLNEIINQWLEIEKLDTNNIIENIEFDSKSSRIKESLVNTARKIIEQYNLTPVDFQIKSNREQKLGLHDFYEVLKMRIDNDDLEGMYNILVSINADDERIKLTNYKYVIINDHYEQGLLRKEEYKILINKIKREYIYCLSHYSNNKA